MTVNPSNWKIIDLFLIRLINMLMKMKDRWFKTHLVRYFSILKAQQNTTKMFTAWIDEFENNDQEINFLLMKKDT